MKHREVQLSKEFKMQTIKAIIAIVFFIFSYLILLLLALMLTGLCIIAAYALISFKPHFFTLAIGLGLAGMGVLILIFLLKFIFKSHKVDRSHLTEITESQEPELFKMINDIVQAIGTKFPKKVYLSPEVNASVFYDSSFWSMFLPIKKNLMIGLGLVNTVTTEELKAILSHEFGHFSQRTMKVGSYVYNVNQVIFNMLFDNESYELLVQKWANISQYFGLFVVPAVKITEGIKWILRKLYEVVNKSYLSLSREMEFHADEIAASVTGFEPMKKSLLRMALADSAYNNVLNYYNGKISENIRSENIFNDQTAVVNFLSHLNKLPMNNSLPDIMLEEQSKYDKSKLVINDQWASHPSIKDRIERLEKTGFTNNSAHDKLANEIFVDIENHQKLLTNKLFEAVTYTGAVKRLSLAEFSTDYKNGIIKNMFPQLYNGYYDNKIPNQFDLVNTRASDGVSDFKEYFSDEKADWVYTSFALQSDSETLKNIANKVIQIKTFDYDGVRYRSKEALALIDQLKTELDAINSKITKNDAAIFAHFLQEEVAQNRPAQLRERYVEFFAFDKAFDARYELYAKLSNELQFVTVVTPFEQIAANFSSIKPIEQELKNEISVLLADNLIKLEVTNEIRGNLESYVSNTLQYFDGAKYIDGNLDILYKAMNNYAFLQSRKYHQMKSALLQYQAELAQR